MRVQMNFVFVQHWWNVMSMCTWRQNANKSTTATQPTAIISPIGYQTPDYGCVSTSTFGPFQCRNSVKNEVTLVQRVSDKKVTSKGVSRGPSQSYGDRQTDIHTCN